MMKLFQKKNHYISQWRWISLVFLSFLVASQDKLFFLQQYCSFTASDFILSELSDITNICFVYLMLLFIVGSDVYQAGRKSITDKTAVECVVTIVVTCCEIAFTFTVIIWIVNATTPMTLSEPFNAELWLHENGLDSHSSIFYLGWAFLLFFFRAFWNLLLIATTNAILKTYIGFVTPFLISIVDTYFYDVFGIIYPQGLLPIEHSRILYTPATSPEVFDRPRFIYSFIYWVCICGLVIILLLLVFLRKSKKHNNNTGGC